MNATSMHLPDEDAEVHFRPVRTASMPAHSRKGPVLVAFFGLLIGLAIVVILAYRNGPREGGTDAPPILRPDAKPLRIEPSNPGGITIPARDAVIEAVQPPPASTAAVTEVEPANPETGIVIEFAGDVADLPPAELAGDVLATAGEVSIADVPEAPLSAAPAPVATLQPAPPPVAAEPVSVTPGDFLVQIASLADANAARQHWQLLQRRYPQILDGQSPDIYATTVSGKGERHRLRIGSFSTREDAMALCNRLKSAGNDCFVVRR
jgi:cell division septation protein DedD